MDGGVPHNETGQVFEAACTPEEGLVCWASQNGGACLDYRVRLLCPTTQNARVQLGTVDCTPSYTARQPPAAECGEGGGWNLPSQELGGRTQKIA